MVLFIFCACSNREKSDLKEEVLNDIINQIRTINIFNGSTTNKAHFMNIYSFPA